MSTTCKGDLTKIKKRSAAATFTASGLSASGLTYVGNVNHELDDDGTAIVVVSAP